MLIGSMVCLVKHEQTDVTPEVYVSVAECVKEHVVRADDDAVVIQYSTPQFRVLPLVWLVRPRDERDREVRMTCNDGFLLLCECDSRCKEP
jgi:hypothetical protein